MSLDPRNLSRPDGLNLIPPGASLDAFQKVIAQPTTNPISFLGLALNSLKIAIGSSVIAVALGITAAYAFSRLRFRGREVLMIAVLGVLMLPAVATIIPLFIFLNQFQIDLGDLSFNLRASLVGVTLAVISAQLPFAIWNLKGYLDTIPKDLEEAAAVDGATQNQIFRKVVLPLAMPAIAVTGFLGFLGGWTEYLTVALFVQRGQRLDAVAGPQQHGRPVRADDELVPVRRVRDPVRAARLGRVLLLPALHRRRPGRRRRQGLSRRVKPRRRPAGRVRTMAGSGRGCDDDDIRDGKHEGDRARAGAHEVQETEHGHVVDDEQPQPSGPDEDARDDRGDVDRNREDQDGLGAGAEATKRRRTRR